MTIHSNLLTCMCHVSFALWLSATAKQHLYFLLYFNVILVHTTYKLFTM